MIEIQFNDGEVISYNTEDYLEFRVEGKFIKINLGDLRVRYYNLGAIKYIEVPEGLACHPFFTE